MSDDPKPDLPPEAQRALAEADARRKAAKAKNGYSPSEQRLKAAYLSYARKLAKTLSKLSVEQQNFIFYGQQ